MKWQLPPDIGMRLLALIIAVALWFVAASDSSTPAANLEERVLSANVSLKGVSDSLVSLTDLSPVQVRVRIPGGVDVPDALTATVNMSNLKAGEHSVRVDVVVPPKFSVVQVVPERLRVRLENKITRAFPVELALIGFPPGESVSVLAPTPATVQLTGGESLVNAVQRVMAMIPYSPALAGQPIPVTVHPIGANAAELLDVTATPEQVEVTFTFQLDEPEPDVDSVADGTDIPPATQLQLD